LSTRFAELRQREFAALGEGVYLNAASVGPLPGRSREILESYIGRRAAVHTLEGRDFTEPPARARAAAARLIGASASEIALVPNTSVGINLAARMLPLERGGVVLISDREFPANVYPWQALASSGVTTEIVPCTAAGLPDEARMLERLARGGVSVLAVSSVQFASGYRMDLERLGEACRACGAFFVVDAIQSLGCLPLEVGRLGVDVLATGGQKWLCSPFGTGFLYVRRGLAEKLEPPFAGWVSTPASEDLGHLLDYAWHPYPDARRFEVGTPPFESLAALATSLELVCEADPVQVEAHVRDLLDPLLRWAEERGIPLASDPAPERRSGIVALLPPDPEGAARALTRAGIVASVREGALRVSPHFYNTPEEMERLLGALNEVLGG